VSIFKLSRHFCNIWLQRYRFPKIRRGKVFSCATTSTNSRDGMGKVLHKIRASLAQLFTQQQNVEEATHPAGSEGEQTTVGISQAKQCCLMLNILLYNIKRGIFFLMFFLSLLYIIQHCFICRPYDSTVTTDAGIEPRTVATSALAVRRSNH
jgi:hypothetical protein